MEHFLTGGDRVTGQLTPLKGTCTSVEPVSEGAREQGPDFTGNIFGTLNQNRQPRLACDLAP